MSFLLQTTNPNDIWLKGKWWDLNMLIFSGIIAFVPYAIYLLLGGGFFQVADDPATPGYAARVTVNLIILALVGGPHMYATFTRTLMEPEVFKKRRFLYAFTSLAIPTFVIGMTIFSYQSYVWLLTIFFSMASFHALQQLVWVTGAYDAKAGIKNFWGKVIDTGLIFASLYPLPVWYITQGSLKIGPVSLKYNDYFQGWDFLAYLAIAAFLIMLTAWLAKTILEIMEKRLHLAKTLLIITAVLVMGGLPLFPNLDTAFQGINVWHSFQYLALTWLALVIFEKRRGRNVAFMHFWKNLYKQSKETANNIPEFWRNITGGIGKAMSKFEQDSGWSSFYLLTILMLPISGMIIVLTQFMLPDIHAGLPGADEAYTYMGILSILLVHYVHDALLFVDHEDLVMVSS